MYIIFVYCMKLSFLCILICCEVSQTIMDVAISNKIYNKILLYKYTITNVINLPLVWPPQAGVEIVVVR